jgi:DNA-directed RNA polymerase specialized sigma24 family protein
VALDPELLWALDALTPLQREVVVLRFVADLPIADVARIVRRPRTAVKALQARGLAHLEATLR